MCLEEDINSLVDCTTGRAGIRRFHIAQCDAISALTFNATTRLLTGITMNLAHPVPVFLEIVPEENTGSFNQAKTRNRRNINVVQTISGTFPIATSSLSEKIVDLNNCCCYIAIVEDNNGQRHVAGVSYDRATNTWFPTQMRTGEGSSNTGADPTADSNELLETLVASVNNYAPFADSTLVIPV